jgi:hypothetical protein
MAPAMIGSIGLGGTIAGGVLGAGGAINKGLAEQDMYNYQAGVADINAYIADQNSGFALQKGDKEVERFGLKAKQQQGAIKAAQAASGLDVNSGSNLEVQESQKLVNQMDAATIRSNAAKTAYDYSTQAASFRNQSKVAKVAGHNSMVSGMIGGLSSIIGTAGAVSDKWLKGREVGLQTAWGSGTSEFQ